MLKYLTYQMKVISSSTLMEMIARAPIVDEMSKSRHSRGSLNKFYYVYKVSTFKIDNALVHQILSKIFTDMDAYVYMK